VSLISPGLSSSSSSSSLKKNSIHINLEIERFQQTILLEGPWPPSVCRLLTNWIAQTEESQTLGRDSWKESSLFLDLQKRGKSSF
jgi:hypothetical protein